MKLKDYKLEELTLIDKYKNGVEKLSILVNEYEESVNDYEKTLNEYEKLVKLLDNAYKKYIKTLYEL